MPHGEGAERAGGRAAHSAGCLHCSTPRDSRLASSVGWNVCADRCGLRGHTIHVDGKSLRGSHSGIEWMAHLASAWDSATGGTLGSSQDGRQEHRDHRRPAVAAVAGHTRRHRHDRCDGMPARDRQADLRAGGRLHHRGQEQPAQSGAGGGGRIPGEAPGLREGRLDQSIEIFKGHGRRETRRCVATIDLSTLNKAMRAAWPASAVW
jgi:hypothetical protein